MKSIKKITAILLTIVMLIPCVGSALSAFAEDYSHLPQLYVNGIGSRAVYDINDPEKKSLFYPVNTELMLDNLNNLGEYVKKSAENLEPDVLYTIVYSWAMDSFGMIAFREDGSTPVYDNIVTDPCPLDYQGNGKYHFNYDSRVDPVELAHKLHDYVLEMQEHSGSQRFELVGSSYGTSIVMAYLNEYPEDRQFIDSIVLCVPSLGGVDFVGQLFTGDFTLDADTLTDFISFMVANEDINLLMSVLNKSGALEAILTYFLDPFLRVAVLRALKDFAHDVFATLPAMWSFVKDEYFYEALEHLYGEDYDSDDHQYAVLIDKLIYYHENVMVRTEEIFEICVQEGIHTNIICKYGRPPMPLSEHKNYMSDGLVGVETASFGCTSCDYGEVLPKDYEQQLYKEYNMISADGCIDASTGALPFNTWYIKGLEHGEKTGPYFEFINKVAYENLDVFTDPAYPQFIQVASDGSESIVPLTHTEQERETSLLEDFLKLVIRLIKLISTKLSELFKGQSVK